MRRTLAATLAIVVLAMPYASFAAVPPPVCLEPVIACPKPAPPPKPDLAAYHGLGTWLDAYDYSREYHGRIAPSAVDDMASQGVKTLYIQAAKEKAGTTMPDVLSSDLLGQFLTRAHAKKMRVVAWFLPRLVDPAEDWRHLDGILAFRASGQGFDAVGVDIESREVGDLKTRNDRLVALSAKLRQNASKTMGLSAIVVPPVVTDVINKSFWPSFPWARLKPSYDVWAPMAYYTNRTTSSGYRDAYTYVTENVRLLRKDLDDQATVVHVIGGVGTTSTSKDYDGLVRGAKDSGSIGASSYDYGVTARSAWATLRKSPG